MAPRTIISIVSAGDIIPFDGTIIDGVALVDESAETGVSKPVLLDNAEGRNNALANTLIVDGWLKIESPLDARMRDRTENDKPPVDEVPWDDMPEPDNGKSSPGNRGGAIAFAICVALIIGSVPGALVLAATSSTSFAVSVGIVAFLLGLYESLSPPLR